MITEPAREIIQSGINGFAREMIQSGFNDYFILGCAIGFFLGIELLILYDIYRKRDNEKKCIIDFDCKDEVKNE